MSDRLYAALRALDPDDWDRNWADGNVPPADDPRRQPNRIGPLKRVRYWWRWGRHCTPATPIERRIR